MKKLSMRDYDEPFDFLNSKETVEWRKENARRREEKIKTQRQISDEIISAVKNNQDAKAMVLLEKSDLNLLAAWELVYFILQKNRLNVLEKYASKIDINESFADAVFGIVHMDQFIPVAEILLKNNLDLIRHGVQLMKKSLEFRKEEELKRLFNQYNVDADNVLLNGKEKASSWVEQNFKTRG